MDERKHDQIEEFVSMTRKIEWTPPEVDRFLAGGAESSDGASVDAADFLS